MIGHPEDLPLPLSFMAKSWKPLGKMPVSGTGGGGSQDLGPLSGCRCSKESHIPRHSKLQGSPWHPRRKAVFFWLLQTPCSSDSLCFGTVYPAGCHFSCPLHSRQGDVHSAYSSKFLPPWQLSDATSHTLKASLQRGYKPHSEVERVEEYFLFFN